MATLMTTCEDDGLASRIEDARISLAKKHHDKFILSAHEETWDIFARITMSQTEARRLMNKLRKLLDGTPLPVAEPGVPNDTP